MNINFSCLINSDNLIVFFFSLPWYKREDQGCERERGKEVEYRDAAVSRNVCPNNVELIKFIVCLID